MNIPRRGDTRSLLAIALAVLVETFAWIFAAWVPAILVLTFVYVAFTRGVTALEATVLPILLVVSLGAAWLGRDLSRRLLAGSRAAYYVMALLIMIIALQNILAAMSLRNTTSFLRLGMAVAHVFVALLVSMMAVRAEEPNA